ncbi:MAG: hypothetical protein Q8L59_13155, partial [Phenylobacterium sp.]|nr:hypothetical protein [Phenylobacterium sp.]
SPFNASSATLALKSAVYRFRFPVIKSVLHRGRTYLSQLSEFPAPPQSEPVEFPDDEGIAGPEV